MMKKQTRSSMRRLQHESLENRICLTSVGWDGPGQGSATLTYTVGDAPASVGQANFEAAIETALDAWSDVADIEFVETDQTGLRDSIDFTFANIDGRGDVLAQAYFPDDVNPARIAGDVQFDSSESWEIGNAQGSRASDLVWVAVHEIGHSLGLEHDHDHDAVLAPTVSPNQSFRGLDDADIDAILELYAPASPSTVATPTPEAPSVDVTPTLSTPDPGTTDSPVDTPDDSVDDGADDHDEAADPSSRWQPRWRGRSPWTTFRVWRWRFDSGADADDTSSSDAEDTGSDQFANRGQRTFSVRPGFRIRIWRV